MRSVRLRLKKGFRVVAGTRRSQAAMMVIPPGDSEGGPDNRHGGDQWLLVLSGAGRAVVEGRKVPLRPGVLLLIEKKEKHQITNTGRRELKTLNFYAPPQF